MTNILLATAAPATGTKAAPRSPGQSSAGFEAAMAKVLTASSTSPGTQSGVASARPGANSTLAEPVAGPVISAPTVAASAVEPETELLSGQPITAGQSLVGHPVPANEVSAEQAVAASVDDGLAEAASVFAGPSAAAAIPAGMTPAHPVGSPPFEPNPGSEGVTSENGGEPEAADASVADASKNLATDRAHAVALPAAPAAPDPASSTGPAPITPALTTSPANASAVPATPTRPRSETPILAQGVARAIPAREPSIAAAGARVDAATRGTPATIERDLPTTAQPANPSQMAQSMAVPPASVTAAAPVTAIAPPTAAPFVPFTAQIAGPVFSLSSAAQGEHVLTINVAPDNLGPVTVRAHVSGDGIRVELFAPTDAGRDALRAIMPELRRDLSGSGMSANLELASGDRPTDDDGPVRERASQDQRDERERTRDSAQTPRSQRADDQAGRDNASRDNRDAASTLDVLV